jgi:hypothetical protein
MEIIVALMGLALAVAVAVYIAAPFTARPREIAVPEESSRDRLLAERNTILTAIRDLDFDFQTGKLLEEDYRTVREKYAVRGVAILKELDALPQSDRKPVAPARRQKAVAMDEIEAAVQARRKARSQVASHAAEDDDIEAAVRARRRSARRNPQSEIQAMQCPACGKPVDSIDKFCAKCGAALNAEATR